MQGRQVRRDRDGVRAGWVKAEAALGSVIQQFSDTDAPGGGWAAGRQRGPVRWGRGPAPKAMKY